MREQLSRLLEDITSLREQIASAPDSMMQQYSPPAVALASVTADLLVKEILDWRVVFLDQPLRPPA